MYVRPLTGWKGPSEGWHDNKGGNGESSSEEGRTEPSCTETRLPGNGFKCTKAIMYNFPFFVREKKTSSISGKLSVKRDLRSF